MFEKMAREGTNPDLKNYASREVKTLRNHLETARNIESKIEGKA
jgi:hypothetical protein